MLSDFLSFIFPHACAACGCSLLKSENHICTYCLYRLPKTNFHLLKDNPITKFFLGRVPIVSAASLYYFTKGGSVQKLIHQLKYKGKKEIGNFLGSYYGQELNGSEHFSSIEGIIPVPLHKKKQKKRGYNQSDIFAQGLSSTMNIEVLNNILERNHFSDTQTRKTRFNRWRNVKDIFEITTSEKIQGKHILLVDDVVTTGATLEACTNKLLESSASSVSIATIAAAV